MKFSESWLREFIKLPIDTNALTHQLTMAGLEVDSVQSAYTRFEGLVVAEIKSVKKHPNSDRLYICKLDCGETDLLTVVCSASNVREGLRTVLAKVGAILPGRPKLAATVVNGIKSDGMLCSEAQIGLKENSNSIIELAADEPIGISFRELIHPDDSIIEISVTPNRGDCLSLRGIAREVAVLNKVNLVKEKIERVKPTIKAKKTVHLLAGDACPRYVSRLIEGVDAHIQPPLWMIERLRCSGIRSINVVVDIINYVLLELGQPMHAFDNDCLKGDMTVRYPKKNESITLLDQSEHQLKADTLLIADDANPLALAGIMGNHDSAVTEKSRNLFLESAFFNPKTIIGQARQYGLHTDSSRRFERGVDPELQMIAIERATGLILELCGGQPGPIMDVKNEVDLPKRPTLILRKSQIKRVLGVELDNEFVTTTLQSLGIVCEFNLNQWIASPPSHRFDIQAEIDLIEELARIYSYDAIVPVIPQTKLKLTAPNAGLLLMKKIKALLINRDYQEVITYSFVDPNIHTLLKNNNKTMRLSNPIAPELSEMRTSIWPGLLTSLIYNLKRQQERVRIFESGLVFKGNDNLKQVHHISGLIYGNIYRKQWNKDNNLCNLYDIKSDVETILSTIISPENGEYRNSKVDMLHPGQAVDVFIDGEQVGLFGQLHPAIRMALAIPGDVYLFELYSTILSKRKAIRYRPISQYPSVKRDIAILVDEEVAAADIMREIKTEATDLLVNLQLFDVYRGKGIEKRKKSLALGLTFQRTSSTLKDKEVEFIMGNIVDGLHNRFGAKLRK